MMQRLAEGSTIYEMVQDSSIMPIEKVLKLINSYQREGNLESALINSDNPILRYWAIAGIGSVTGSVLIPPLFQQTLQNYLDDPFPSIQIQVATLLCEFGECDNALPVLVNHLNNKGARMLMAARAIQYSEARTERVIPEVQEIQKRLCKIAEDRSRYYELYACWALSEWMKQD